MKTFGNESRFVNLDMSCIMIENTKKKMRKYLDIIVILDYLFCARLANA